MVLEMAKLKRLKKPVFDIARFKIVILLEIKKKFVHIFVNNSSKNLLFYKNLWDKMDYFEKGYFKELAKIEYMKELYRGGLKPSEIAKLAFFNKEDSLNLNNEYGPDNINNYNEFTRSELLSYRQSTKPITLVVENLIKKWKEEFIFSQKDFDLKNSVKNELLFQNIIVRYREDAFELADLIRESETFDSTKEKFNRVSFKNFFLYESRGLEVPSFENDGTIEDFLVKFHLDNLDFRTCFRAFLIKRISDVEILFTIEDVNEILDSFIEILDLNDLKYFYKEHYIKMQC